MLTDLTILTLNVWGIPFISRDREVRIEAIGNELAKGLYDVVSLQEVWSDYDFQRIKKKTENVLPFAHYFYSGVFGSGLCIFSKYPIVNAFFHAWSVNGYVHRIQHGDWFGGKGVGLCRILVYNKPVNVYIAHLHAEYDMENDEYKAHRVIQAFDTAQFIESTRSDSVLQILAGDLNTEPHDIAYKVLLRSSKMIDCCNDHENIGTNECKKNSYTAVDAAKKNPIGKRIDHILIRPGDNYKVDTCQYRLPLSDRIPGQSFSYSDHEAVTVLLKIVEKHIEDVRSEGGKDFGSCPAEGCEVDTYETMSALQDCISMCDSSLNKLKSDRIIYFTMALLVTFLLIAIMDTSIPYGLKTLFLVTKFLLSGIIIFFLFMATIWNVMERHGILSGKLSMEIAFRNFENKSLK